MSRAKEFLKREPVLCAAGAAALASCIASGFRGGYAEAVDWRVLALLYCLMAVVAAAESAGIFARLAGALAARAQSGRALCLALVLACFFSAMLVTNDVALITFVPFAVLVLGASGQQALLPWVVSLQTIAANLGSMLTPVGNPQNLYLYNRYGFSVGAFFALTGPAVLVSFLLLGALSLALPARAVQVRPQAPLPPFTRRQKRQLALCAALFCLCLAAVFRLLPWPFVLAVVVLALAVFDRRLLAGADFALLATFVCFFVFVANLSQMEAVRGLLAGLLAGRELVCGALASQVISNVPAAVLLAGFTENGPALVLGTNFGGLGTPVASLASLISLKAYAKVPGASMGRYLAVFSGLNFGLLALLLGLAWIGIL